MDPTRYPSTRPDWERVMRTTMNPAIAERQNQWDYPVDDADSPIAVCNFNAVGGSTILYSGHFPRFLPNDFSVCETETTTAEWPIKYADLEPYFRENEHQMSVSGLVGDPMYPDIDSLLPPIPLGQAGTRLALAFNSKGWHWWPSYSAISTRAVHGRNKCINLGPCNTGCPQGAKSSTDITYVAKARDLGLVLLDEFAVGRVVVEEGRAIGVEAHDANGHVHQIRAHNVVLAASAVGTARILLNSATESSPHGLANGSGQVGRNLMMHPLGYAEGIFDEDLDADIGPQGCMLYSLEHYRLKGREKHVNTGYMLQGLRGAGPSETAVGAYRRKSLRVGVKLHEDFAAVYRRQVGIGVICEDLPSSQNCIKLDHANVDRFGVPGVRVEYRLAESTRKTMIHGLARAKELLSVAGAKKIYAHGPVRNSGWHVMGTARMGTNPSTSVVGPDGQTHEIRGLYVVDSSVFVSSSCVNPANTIQAVALYLADGMGHRAKQSGVDANV